MSAQVRRTAVKDTTGGQHYNGMGMSAISTALLRCWQHAPDNAHQGNRAKPKGIGSCFAPAATDLSQMMVLILGHVQGFSKHMSKRTWEDPQFASPGSCAW